MNGLIFSVRRYSIHDGPGIRVTFFMKGCPLRCLWCHNPEGISPFPETVVQTNKVSGKEFSNIEEAGKYYTVENILDILDKERVFINQSGGGVTFSGGEPMLQFEFLLETLMACKSNGYHTTVDTSGYSSAGNFRSIIPFTDLFLFDIKHMNEDEHIEFTGISNKEILENCRLILEYGREIIIRIPVIPDYNYTADNMDKIKRFLLTSKTTSLKKISLLPFHKTGSSKYRKFDIPYRMRSMKTPDKEGMQKLKEFFAWVGVKVKIGG